MKRTAAVLHLLRVHCPVTVTHRCRHELCRPARAHTNAFVDRVHQHIFDAHGVANISATMKQQFLAAAARVGYLNPPEHRKKDPTDDQLDELEQKLGYKFSERSLLRLALVHSSAGVPSNWALAWLGDAALQLIVSEQLVGLMDHDASPGSLTEMRQTFVSREKCGNYATALGLPELIVVGKAFLKQNEPVTQPMAAECFEAVLGAMHVDAGMDTVRNVFLANIPIKQVICEGI